MSWRDSMSGYHESRGGGYHESRGGGYHESRGGGYHESRGGGYHESRGYPDSRPGSGMPYYGDSQGYMSGFPGHHMMGGLGGPPMNAPQGIMPVGSTFPPSMGYMRPPNHEAGMMRMMRSRFMGRHPPDHNAPMYLPPSISIPPSPSPLPQGPGFNVLSPPLSDVYGGHASGMPPHGHPSQYTAHGESRMDTMGPVSTHMPSMPRMAAPSGPSPGAMRYIPPPPPLKLAPGSRNTPSVGSSNRTPSQSPAPSWHSPMTSPLPVQSQSPTLPQFQQPAMTSWHTPVTSPRTVTPDASLKFNSASLYQVLTDQAERSANMTSSVEQPSEVNNSLTRARKMTGNVASHLVPAPTHHAGVDTEETPIVRVASSGKAIPASNSSSVSADTSSSSATDVLEPSESVFRLSSIKDAVMKPSNTSVTRTQPHLLDVASIHSSSASAFTSLTQTPAIECLEDNSESSLIRASYNQSSQPVTKFNKIHSQLNEVESAKNRDLCAGRTNEKLRYKAESRLISKSVSKITNSRDTLTSVSSVSSAASSSSLNTCSTVVCDTAVKATSSQNNTKSPASVQMSQSSVTYQEKNCEKSAHIPTKTHEEPVAPNLISKLAESVQKDIRGTAIPHVGKMPAVPGTPEGSTQPASTSTATDEEILAALYGKRLQKRSTEATTKDLSLNDRDSKEWILKGSATDDEKLFKQSYSTTKDGCDKVNGETTRQDLVTVIDGDDDDVLCVVTRNDSGNEDTDDANASETETASSQAALESSSATSLPQIHEANTERDGYMMGLQIQDVRSFAESSSDITRRRNSIDMVATDGGQSSTEVESASESMIALPEYTSIEGSIVDLAADAPKPVSYPIQNVSIVSPEDEQMINNLDLSPEMTSPINKYTSPRSRVGHGFKCTYCNYEGRSEKSLRKHIRAHSSSYKICQYCKKAFERPSDLARHEERHERNMEKTGGDPSLLSKGQVLGVTGPEGFTPAIPTDEQYKCRKCEFITNRFHKLALHNRQKHSVKYSCTFCPMVFISPLPLGNHLKRCPQKPRDPDDMDTAHPPNPKMPEKRSPRRNLFNNPERLAPMKALFDKNVKAKKSPNLSSYVSESSQGIARLDNFKKDVLLKSDLVEVAIGEENELILSIGEIGDSALESSSGDIPVCANINQARMAIESHIQAQRAKVENRLQSQQHMQYRNIPDEDTLHNDRSNLKVPSPFKLTPTGPQPHAVTFNEENSYIGTPCSSSSTSVSTMPSQGINIPSSTEQVNTLTPKIADKEASLYESFTLPSTSSVAKVHSRVMPVVRNGVNHARPESTVIRPEPTYMRPGYAFPESEPYTGAEMIHTRSESLNAKRTESIPEYNRNMYESQSGPMSSPQSAHSSGVHSQDDYSHNLNDIPMTVTDVLEEPRLDELHPSVNSAHSSHVSKDVSQFNIGSPFLSDDSVSETRAPTIKKEFIPTSTFKQKAKKSLVVIPSLPKYLKGRTSKTVPSTSLTPMREKLFDKVRDSGRDGIFFNHDPTQRKPSKTPRAESPTNLEMDTTEVQIMRPNAVRHKVSRYYCKRCNYGTDAKRKMDEHMRAHTGRFICKHCNKACIKASDLYRHWVTHNLKDDMGNYICDTCDFVSLDKEIVMNHLRIHYLIRQNRFPDSHNITVCGLCGKSFTRSQLFVHKKMVHSNKPASLTSAAASVRNARGWNSKPKVVNNMDITENGLSFKCPECDDCFSTEFEMNSHFEACHMCMDASFLNETFQMNDDASKDTHSVSEETEQPSKQTVQQNQQKPLSSSSSTISASPPGSPRVSEHVPGGVECGYCGRKFQSKRQLIGHEKMHYSSPRGRQVARRRNGHKARRKVCSCPHCHKRFKSQYYMAQHEKLHTGEKPFQCLKCGEKFALSQACQNHIRRGCPARRERRHVLVNQDRPDNTNNAAEEDCVLIDAMPSPVIEIVKD